MDLREPLIEATRKLKALREQLDEINLRAQEPIAIVSMACRLPGGVDSPESFWRLLEAGGDAIEPFPATRWNAQDLYSPDPDAPGKTYCTQGGFVHEVDAFDAAFFGIAPREAESMDPAHRLALECAWELLERAGIPPRDLVQSQTGVYLGTVYSDYEPWGGRLGMVGMDGYGFTGRDGSVLSGRISYVLGLRGPSLTVNTACSSSLVALHLATQALRRGECTLAVCGGSQVMSTPGCFVEFSRLRGLSPEGRCKSFSDLANGVGWAEGCSLLLLERLSEARRKGHPVLALVRGTAINQDGRSQGFTAPNGPAQERVIERALEESGLERHDIDAVEAHGTGTSLGDPIEAGALAAALGKGRSPERPLYVGSAKSNLGHTQAASGATGVMKMVLALGRERLPRTLHVNEPSGRIAWEGSGLKLLQKELAWPRGARVRRAGVNSFGISGTNAHVVLEEAPPEEPARAPLRNGHLSPGSVPLLLSGADPTALRAQALRLAEELERRPDLSTRDLAFSLATARSHLPARLAMVVPADRGAGHLIAPLREVGRNGSAAGVSTGLVARRPGKLVMLFSGQGSQRPGVGEGLYRELPTFRAALDGIWSELDPRLPRPLREVMFAPAESEASRLLDRTEYAQPALFALELALFRQWESWGLFPDLVLGHSIGELTAAHVAGVFSLPDACALVAARGRLMQGVRADGAMFSLGVGESEVARLIAGLEDKVSIAALNAPEQTVLSGDATTVEGIARALEKQGKRVHRLQVSHAFHSPHMDAILEEYRRVAERVTYHAPRIPLLTNLDGVVAAERVCSAEYWVRQVRGAVRFQEAVRTAESLGASRYLECGPHGVLTALAAQSTGDPEASFLSTLQKGRAEVEAFTDALGRAHLGGAALRWEEVFSGQGARRVDLPTYAFQRSRYWLPALRPELPDLKSAGMGRGAHPLLGAEISLADGGRIFTARISPSALSWLADHRVFEQAVLPGMALLELLLTAGSRAGTPELQHLTLEAPLVLPPEPVQLQVALAPVDSEGRRAVQVHSRLSGGEEARWVRHASGTLQPPTAHEEAVAPLEVPAGAAPLPLEGLYQRLAGRGLQYGPAFQALMAAHRLGQELYGRVVLPEHLQAEGHAFHPALLDASLHLLLAAAGPETELRVPLELERAWLAPPAAAVREVVVRASLGPASSAGTPSEAALTLHDPAGRWIGSIGRVGLRAISRERLASTASATPTAGPVAPPPGQLYGVRWTRVDPPPRRAASGGYAVIGSGPLSNEVAAALRAAGATVARFDAPSELAERLREQEGGVSTVVRVPDAPRGEGGAESALRETTRLLRELQAWTRDPRLGHLRYALVTRGAISAPGNAPAVLSHSPLWGLLRSARNEHPERQWLLLDIDGEEASQQSLGEALLATDQAEVALRKGARLVPRLVPAEAPMTTGQRVPSPDGTVLITGGLSGLGAQVALHLAGRHGMKQLLLLSRQGPAAPGAAELLARLHALGASARAAACDVADAAALQHVLEEIPPAHPLTAVFHCAAVLEDGLLPSVTPESLSRVFSSKATGAFHLHELTRGRELACFVVFSSIAGVTGNEGQSAYAAANTFLDALSATRRAEGLPGQSLAWGTWSEVGMASRLSSRQQERVREKGLAPLSPPSALALLDRALAMEEALLVPLGLDRGALEGEVRSPLARLLSSASPTAPQADPPERLSFRDRLAAAPQGEREPLLLDLVRGEVAAVLRLPDTSSLRAERPLDELGMDSLMAVDIRRRLEGRLGMQLPATLVFDHPSSGALVQYLAIATAQRGPS